MNRDEIKTFAVEFFEKLGRLLNNGVPLVSALKAAAAEKHSEPTSVIESLVEELMIGNSLSDAMKNQPLFTNEIVTAIAHAEREGILDEELIRIAQALRTGEYSLGEQSGVKESSRKSAAGEMAESTINTVNRLIVGAFRSRASDLHIDPDGDGSSIRFRIDGVLHAQKERYSREQHRAIVSRIKIMAALDPAECQLPQDGRILLDLTKEDSPDAEKVRVDVRVSICPFILGEKVVLRFLEKYQFPENLESIGLIGNNLATIERWLKAAFGIIIVTGPTGSGKTTTLYMLLRALAVNPSINVASVEEPVEYLLPGVNQMQVAPAIGLTFPAALRSILRQDPDVVCIAELRDPETAKMLGIIAHTGHLVLCQLHAKDGVAALRLLLELGIPLHTLRETFLGVVAQRLVRKLCTSCKKPTPAENNSNLPLPANASTFDPVGCEGCHRTGYKGRIALYELLEPTAKLWDGLARNASEEELRAMLSKDHSTLRDHGLELMAKGETTLAEIQRVTSI